MYYALARSAMDSAMATAQRLGVTVPKHIAAEHAKIRDLAVKARAFEHELRTEPMSTAALAALEAGNDPTADPEVQRAVVRRALGELPRGLDGALSERAQAFAEEYAPTILGLFAEPFAQAAATITQALESLGDVDLDDTAAVLSRGGDSAMLWAQAKGADKAIGDIRQVRGQLANVAPQLAVDPQYRLLSIADVPPAAFIDDQLFNSALGALAAAQRGFELSAADPDTLAERVRGVMDELQRRQSQQDDAFRREYRRLHGAGAAS